MCLITLPTALSSPAAPTVEACFAIQTLAFYALSSGPPGCFAQGQLAWPYNR